MHRLYSLSYKLYLGANLPQVLLDVQVLVPNLPTQHCDTSTITDRQSWPGRCHWSRKSCKIRRRWNRIAWVRPAIQQHAKCIRGPWASPETGATTAWHRRTQIAPVLRMAGHTCEFCESQSACQRGIPDDWPASYRIIQSIPDSPRRPRNRTLALGH